MRANYQETLDSLRGKEELVNRTSEYPLGFNKDYSSQLDNYLKLGGFMFFKTV